MARRKKPQPHPLYYVGSGICSIPVYANRHQPFYRGSNTHYSRQRLVDISLYILLRARDRSKRGLNRQLFVDMRMNAKILCREVVKRIGAKRKPRDMEDICRDALRIYAVCTQDDTVRSQYMLNFQQ